jgi:hypothetical protein
MFLQFINDISPGAWWLWANVLPVRNDSSVKKEEYNFNKAVASKCLSVLSLTKVLNADGSVIIELDDPNPNILPLSDEAAKRLKEKCERSNI